MNVLITSVGRRVELVKCFKKSLSKLGGKVVGIDCNQTSQAGYFCDKFFSVSKIDSGEYIDELVKICKDEKIALLIPSIDTELEILSENRERFLEEASTILNISNPKVVKICQDKYNTYEFFKANKINTPELFDIEKCDISDDKFPLFIKPSDGSSSINSFWVRNKNELNFFKNYVPNPILQKGIVGKEYTIDALCDFEGNPVTLAARQRLQTRSGEISKGKTTKNKNIIDASLFLLEKLKPQGAITIQCIDSDDEIFFTEINARVGGGLPMSVAANCDIPSYLIKLAMGEKIPFNTDYKDNYTILRFDDCVVLDENLQMVDKKF